MELPLRTLQTLLDFHYQRREELYDVAAGLTPEELIRPFSGSSYGNLLGVLLHNLDVERFWVRQVLMAQPVPDLLPEDHPDLPSVRAAAAAVRQATKTFVAGLTEQDFTREVTYILSPDSADSTSTTIGAVLMQVILHDVYHRGQALLLAQQMGREVPDMDLLR